MFLFFRAIACQILETFDKQLPIFRALPTFQMIINAILGPSEIVNIILMKNDCVYESK